MNGARQPYGGSRTVLERTVERTIFASRWLLAPFYLGLAISLLCLLVRFVQKTIRLVANTTMSGNDLITDVLSLVDLSLVASLVLMVMFAGYENFVSSFEQADEKYRPSWMAHVDFGELKVKLLTSIVAISAIHVLEAFMDIEGKSDRTLGWGVGILLAFVVCGVLLAYMGRLSGDERG